jgi:hypothetical protein
LLDRSELRAASLYEPDANAPAQARRVRRGPSSAVSPSWDDGLDTCGAETMLSKGLNHLLALPGEIRRLPPMLQLAAAASAKVAALRWLTLGTGRQHLDYLGPLAGYAGPDPFTGQTERGVQNAVLGDRGGVSACAH